MVSNQQIEFPVDWHFRVICDGQADVLDELCKVLKGFGVNEIPQQANQSSGGKYISYGVKVTFNDKASMDLMSQQLGAVNGVKMVL